MAEKLDPQQVKPPAGGEGGEKGVVEVTYEIDCRKARSFCSPRNSYV